jgi:hypothetical protein
VGRPLSDSVRALCRPILKQQGLHTADIFLSWEEIVGVSCAQVTLPTKFQRTATGDATLHVQVLRREATEIRYHTPKIIARIHQYFGFPCVQKLILHAVDSLPLSQPNTSAPQEEREEESDSSLEARLQRLQRAICDP